MLMRHSLFGPAGGVLAAARQLATREDRFGLLLEGDPGIGKTALADQLAEELTGSPFAVEMINGQSVLIERVREWRQAACYGNLFSDWTVKRIDELDQASSSGMAELLTYLDYLPPKKAVIATTNEYAKLRALCKGRLETRFIRYHVDAPTVAETAGFLKRQYRLAKETALAIARGAVPDGCLETAGCNVRAAINDARGLAAAQASNTARRAA